MADQHHDSNPAMGNQIAADIPDILENNKYHWDILQMLIGVHATNPLAVSPPGPQRSKFRWKDADEIYIGPGVYFHDGTNRQTVFWDAEITFQLGSGGSNAGSDDVDAGAVDVHYIYLDDSAIVTQASPELDADCFLNSKTGPTWSDAKHGWYNGSDRCIFAVITSAANEVLDFIHDGGNLVQYADSITDFSDTTLTDSPSSKALTIPAFAISAQVTFEGQYIGAACSLRYAPADKGDATNYTNILYIDADVAYIFTTLRVFTDSSQQIEVWESANTGNNFSILTMGWYFPTGM